MKEPQVKYLKDYTPPHHLVDRIHLDVDLYDDHAMVHSRMDIRQNPDNPDDTAAFELDGKDLSLVSIALDKIPLDDEYYSVNHEGLTLKTPPQNFVLDIVTRITPRENTSLEGLYMAGETFLTQCEAEGFRRITYFPDRPDVMSRYSCSISADKTRYPMLLSNGDCTGTEDVDDNRHKVTWNDPYPKPCYLFALVAGDMALQEDTFTTAEGRNVSLKFYVDKGDEDKCAHAISSLKKSMAWDEKVYGRCYDLDTYMIVSTHAFNAGAMENKGLNVFNSKYVLAKPETATDTDFQNVEGVIAHEYFHNWTGNRVTLNSWFQLSLKEGLTVFRDQEFSSDMGSRAIKRIVDVRGLRAGQFPEDAGPMAHPIRPESYMEMNNFYTATVYNKGAEVIRMIHTLLGAKGFKQGMDLYFERFDGKAVTTEDFVKAMEDGGGKILSQFRLWYSQAGTPVIRVSRHYDKATKTYTLTLTQSLGDTPGQSNKKPMMIPVKLALLGSSGEALPLYVNGKRKEAPEFETTLAMTREKDVFKFTDIDEEPVPSLFHGFSAPVIVKANYSAEDLMFLMAHDTDDFNRWDASQTLFVQTIRKLMADARENKPMALPESLVPAVKQTLNDENADKALIAQILTIPSETELGDQMDEIDVDAIHEAREFLMNTLAHALDKEFKAAYDSLKDNGPYTIDPQAIARRKLKNAALCFLAYCDKKPDELLYQEFCQAKNMTDALASLTLLSHQESALKHTALRDFHEKWKNDPLVLDKWFAVQASSPCADTLEKVSELTGHPDFSITNPNKVRALIGTFAHANPYHFHDKKGKAYAFVADQIIRLDKINPSIASRLATCFNKWKRYDEPRQKLIKHELTRIVETKDLSKAVFEIVSKALKV